MSNLYSTKGIVTKLNTTADGVLVYLNNEKKKAFWIKSKKQYKLKIESGNFYLFEYRMNAMENQRKEITKFVPAIPDSQTGIKKYLPKIKGVGKKTAERLINHFGNETVEQLINCPALINEFPFRDTIKHELIRHFEEENKKYTFANQLATEFDKNVEEILCLISYFKQKYDKGFLKLLNDSPYFLMNELKIEFQKYDRFLSETIGVPINNILRIEQGISRVLEYNLQLGNTVMDLASFYLEVASLLEIGEAVVINAVEEVLSQNNSYFEIIDEDKVVVKKMNRIEEELAWHLHRVASSKASRQVILNRLSKTNEQEIAINLVFKNSVCLVTGKAGTGKTTLISKIIKIAQKENLNVELVAFTGKAAEILREKTGYPATTIHSLLYQTAIIQSDILIIDEASMVDVELVNSLLRAVQTGSRVVLMGDTNQIKSIGPGNVLHDLISSQKLAHIELTNVHRQGKNSPIRLNANRLLENREFLIIPNQNEFNLINADEQSTIKYLEAAYHWLWSNGYHPMTDIQVLSLYNSKDKQFGSFNVNCLLQNWSASDDWKHGDKVACNGCQLGIGDKVIQTVNNKKKNIYNGEVGYVVYVNSLTHIVRVAFGEHRNKVVTFREEELSELTLANCLTVHKAQGSEYPAVILLVPSESEKMINRETIYSAITRAKQKLFIIGDLQLLNKKLFEEETLQRNTLLGKYIGEQFENENNESMEQYFGNIDTLEFEWK